MLLEIVIIKQTIEEQDIEIDVRFLGYLVVVETCKALLNGVN